ncbi:hypothetical protein [Desulfocurvibacter africanus]|nr:hypothetical protein [Desulfocurvibacter africanus]
MVCSGEMAGRGGPVDRGRKAEALAYRQRGDSIQPALSRSSSCSNSSTPI